MSLGLDAEYFMLPGFRARPSKKVTGHWMGGEHKIQGATCKVCKKPLLLLWSIDAVDVCFKGAFKDFERIYLFYCWRCSASFTYSIESLNKIKLHAFEGKSNGANFPYPNYPLAFPRTAMKLEKIPYEIEKLLLLTNVVDGQEYEPSETSRAVWLSKADRNKLKKWSLLKGWHLYKSFSQFGGLPYLIQGRELKQCPACDSSWVKILSSIYEEPALPMLAPKGDSGEHVNVVHYICRSCMAITAHSQCD